MTLARGSVSPEILRGGMGDRRRRSVCKEGDREAVDPTHDERRTWLESQGAPKGDKFSELHAARREPALHLDRHWTGSAF
jgi:hypothetical protein